MDVAEPDSSPSAAPTESPAVPKPASTSPARRRPPPRRASAPGVGLAFDVAAAALTAQMGDVDGLNTRLGGALAATLALAGIAVIGKETADLRALAALALVLAVALSAWASRASKWSSAPDPTWLAQFAGDEPDFMKEVALPGVLRALARNRAQLERKGQFLNWAVACLALAGVLLLVGRILAG
ncbi:MAG TPA: hypothetical protein VNH38_02660 [Candidatus Dormibacteraeota bacterium]|nr:hypothetical protein [Candidatus Dormibacteraeota bacterium]